MPTRSSRYACVCILICCHALSEGFALQWYCEHHGEEDPLLDAGLPREHPLDGVLLGVNGHALAVRYMRWVGQNCPGYIGTRHAPTLVSS